MRRVATGLVGVALACVLSTPAAMAASAPVPPLPDPRAGSWLVADLDTGDILAGSSTSTPRPPASTLKVLTALALLPEIQPDERVPVSPGAAHVEGSKVGLYENQSYRAEDLFAGMLAVSGNDAATALAEARPDTITQMNAVAVSLGATNTRVENVTGLYTPTQVTTAEDLAVIFQAALKEQRFSQIVKQADQPFTRHDGVVVNLHTHGGFTGAYPGALGGKTGYTVQSRASFVGAAERDGHRLVGVVLDADPKPGPRVGELLDWGFQADGKVVPVGHLPEPAPKPTATVTQAAPAPSGQVIDSLPGEGDQPPVWPFVAGGTGLLLVLTGAVLWARRARG